MKASFGIILTALFSWFILHACMSQEQQEEVLQNSEPQSVDVNVNVGGDSRAERFLGTFDQISRLSLDIDRNYGNKRVLTDFPLEHDGARWTGTINKLIVGFDYTVTGHAYKCTDCPEGNGTGYKHFFGLDNSGNLQKILSVHFDPKEKCVLRLFVTT